MEWSRARRGNVPAFGPVSTSESLSISIQIEVASWQFFNRASLLKPTHVLFSQGMVLISIETVSISPSQLSSLLFARVRVIIRQITPTLCINTQHCSARLTLAPALYIIQPQSSLNAEAISQIRSIHERLLKCCIARDLGRMMRDH